MTLTRVRPTWHRVRDGLGGLPADRHGGASAPAPANTLASFDAAVAVGIDIVEFDVREWRGELVLAHTIFHAARSGNVLLGDGSRTWRASGSRAVDLNVDVKHPSFEARLLDDLRGAGLLERTLLSSQVTAVIDRLRVLDPHARTGISSVGKSTERRAYCGRRRGAAYRDGFGGEAGARRSGKPHD